MSSDSNNPSDRGYRTVHVAAIVTAILIFPLVIVGAGVTSKDAGMAFPDWPTSNHHLIDPPGWTQKSDQLWEHGHRLIGWVVGMSAIVLACAGWRRGKLVRTLSLLTLGAIIVQGVLGGLRVTCVSEALAMVHGIWGQLCFCIACTTALVTSSAWRRGSALQAAPAAGVLQKGCLVTTIAILLQLVFGAALRHFGSKDALVAHLLWAVVVALLVGWIAMWVVGQHPANDLIGLLGRVVGVGIAVQLLLGGLTLLVTVMKVIHGAVWVWLLPSAHVAVGAILLASMLLLTLVTHRRLVEREKQNGAHGLAGVTSS